MKLLVLFLLIIALLNGCASNKVEPRTDLCKFSSVTELTGKYVNLGVGKLENRDVYLSEVIWLLSKQEADFIHSDVVDLTIISIKDNITAIASTPDSKQHTVQFNKIVEFEDGAVNLYHDMDILPDPSGGLVVGPQVVNVNLNKDCSDNLVLHKFESADGLLLLLIPVSSELNRYVTFYRVNES
jgi:hypothetical protein